MRAVEAARWLLEVFGSSTSLSWRLRELPKSRSIGPVGVWRPRPLQNSSSGGVGRPQLSSFRERRSNEVENRLVSRVLEGSGSRSLGNPHALAPARASARRLGRHHFGLGTWGLRRRSLGKPWQSPRSPRRRCTQCPCSHVIRTPNPIPRAANALALIRFEHQIRSSRPWPSTSNFAQKRSIF